MLSSKYRPNDIPVVGLINISDEESDGEEIINISDGSERESDGESDDEEPLQLCKTPPIR